MCECAQPCPIHAPARQLSIYNSLYLSRSAMTSAFPHETGKVRKGTIADAVILKRYRAKRAELATAALELAHLEEQLKRRIGFDSAMEVPGEGTLYWTADKSSGGNKPKINWMKLVQDLNIPEDLLKKYMHTREGERRFFFKPGQKLPEGIQHLQGPIKDDEQLDEAL